MYVQVMKRQQQECHRLFVYTNIALILYTSVILPFGLCPQLHCQILYIQIYSMNSLLNQLEYE